MLTVFRIFPLALVVSMLAGCGERPGTAGDGATVATPPLSATEPDIASSKDFGSYVMHFNAIRTVDLTPEVARRFDIVRSPNQVMLNVSLARKVQGALDMPVPAKVNVTARNLANQDKGIATREIRDGEAFYYIGLVPIINEETLVFSIEAVPEGENSPLRLQFKRQFFTN